VNTARPPIAGTPQVGHVLSTSGGTWTTSSTLESVTYQWQRCDRSGDACSDIGGATTSSYTLASSNEGHAMRIAQTVTNDSGAATAVSDPSLVVTAHGEPAYQRLRCDGAGANCASIGGATSSSYTIQTADVGHTLRVQQTVRNAADTATVTSNATSLVGAEGGNEVATAVPTITGKPFIGSTLSTSGARWSSATAITVVSYRWQRCNRAGDACVTIPGARSAPAVDARTIVLPNRLVIRTVKSQRGTRWRSPFTVRFRVTDTSRRPVAGALVYARGVPYAWW